MNIDKATTGASLFLVACAVCCAPLIAPPIVAAIAAGGVGLALVGQLGLTLVVSPPAGFIFSRAARPRPTPRFSH
ncbi:hypothetical protein [Mesorhizobium sp. GbtcB19]|uniref:hypothetical protein n=1 Tax=Mesorhizobium sp. GbtcB19 TaxID=2824764 RepID=UPI001C2FAE34|nr:hypothetical protein [Mesorhizobium sp. GbtcB19]